MQGCTFSALLGCVQGTWSFLPQSFSSLILESENMSLRAIPAISTTFIFYYFTQVCVVNKQDFLSTFFLVLVLVAALLASSCFLLPIVVPLLPESSFPFKSSSTVISRWSFWRPQTQKSGWQLFKGFLIFDSYIFHEKSMKIHFTHGEPPRGIWN